MEEMQEDLAAVGYDVVMTAINLGNAAFDQWTLLPKCSFPLFQDTEDNQAVNALNAAKDDFFVYGKDNTLFHYLPGTPTAPGAVWTHLDTPQGKTNLLNVILGAFNQ